MAKRATRAARTYKMRALNAQVVISDGDESFEATSPQAEWTAASSSHTGLFGAMTRKVSSIAVYDLPLR